MFRRQILTSLIAAAVVVAAGHFSPAFAQKAVSQGDIVTATAVIQAIDSANRLVTLKHEDGSMDTVFAGPEVKRFDALKVGDKVTFKYYESMVYAIQKPGDPKPAEGTLGVVRSKGEKPGGTLSQQITAVVTVTAVDQKVSSISIKTADGTTMSLKVENKKNLEGVKVGDNVQITYTKALAISVESPK